jgi:hypothetical protein
MALTPLPKDTDWQTGIKRKTRMSILYKKPNFKHCLSVKGWKKICQENVLLKQA